jgi:hypothetical protein
MAESEQSDLDTDIIVDEIQAFLRQRRDDLNDDRP